ncbi:hypothetical protein [Rhizobium sp.]
MPRAPEPFTPLQDLEARRLWSGPVVAGVLTSELAEFCESGVSIVMAASGADGLPIAGKALACRILPAGRMRIFLSEAFNALLASAFDQGSPIAVTFSAPHNHRSIQVKATRVLRVPLEEGDGDAVARQVRAFEDDLVFVHYTRRFAKHYTAYKPEETIAIEVSPSEAFVQTPGPGAGEPLSS